MSNFMNKCLSNTRKHRTKSSAASTHSRTSVSSISSLRNLSSRVVRGAQRIVHRALVLGARVTQSDEEPDFEEIESDVPTLGSHYVEPAPALASTPAAVDGPSTQSEDLLQPTTLSTGTISTRTERLMPSRERIVNAPASASMLSVNIRPARLSSKSYVQQDPVSIIPEAIQAILPDLVKQGFLSPSELSVNLQPCFSPCPTENLSPAFQSPQIVPAHRSALALEDEAPAVPAWQRTLLSRRPVSSSTEKPAQMSGSLTIPSPKLSSSESASETVPTLGDVALARRNAGLKRPLPLDAENDESRPSVKRLRLLSGQPFSVRQSARVSHVAVHIPLRSAMRNTQRPRKPLPKRRRVHFEDETKESSPLPSSVLRLPPSLRPSLGPHFVPPKEPVDPFLGLKGRFSLSQVFGDVPLDAARPSPARPRAQPVPVPHPVLQPTQPSRSSRPLVGRRPVKKDPSLRRVAISNRVQRHRVTQVQERNERRFGIPLPAPAPVVEVQNEVIVIEDKTVLAESVEEPAVIETSAFEEPAAIQVKEQELEQVESTVTDLPGPVEGLELADEDYVAGSDDSNRFDHELARSLSQEEEEHESRHGPQVDSTQEEAEEAEDEDKQASLARQADQFLAELGRELYPTAQEDARSPPLPARFPSPLPPSSPPPPTSPRTPPSSALRPASSDHLPFATLESYSYEEEEAQVARDLAEVQEQIWQEGAFKTFQREPDFDPEAQRAAMLSLEHAHQQEVQLASEKEQVWEQATVQFLQQESGFDVELQKAAMLYQEEEHSRRCESQPPVLSRTRSESEERMMTTGISRSWVVGGSEAGPSAARPTRRNASFGAHRQRSGKEELEEWHDEEAKRSESAHLQAVFTEAERRYRAERQQTVDDLQRQWAQEILNQVLESTRQPRKRQREEDLQPRKRQRTPAIPESIREHTSDLAMDDIYPHVPTSEAVDEAPVRWSSCPPIDQEQGAASGSGTTTPTLPTQERVEQPSSPPPPPSHTSPRGTRQTTCAAVTSQHQRPSSLLPPPQTPVSSNRSGDRLRAARNRSTATIIPAQRAPAPAPVPNAGTSRTTRSRHVRRNVSQTSVAQTSVEQPSNGRVLRSRVGNGDTKQRHVASPPRPKSSEDKPRSKRENKPVY